MTPLSQGHDPSSGAEDVEASAERELARFHSDIEQMLAPHDGYKKGLTLTKVHALPRRRGLSASYSALHVTHEQIHDARVTVLEEAWSVFGGVPRRVVLDNLKASVVKADRFEPTFQCTFNE
ncbi:MAG: hypothetical protein AAF654_10040 [Myxococcota bacterium]